MIAALAGYTSVGEAAVGYGEAVADPCIEDRAKLFMRI